MPLIQVLRDWPLLRVFSRRVFFIEVLQSRAIWEVPLIIEGPERYLAGDGLVKSPQPTAILGGIR